MCSISQVKIIILQESHSEINISGIIIEIIDLEVINQLLKFL